MESIVLKELVDKEGGLSSGHRLCGGCAEGIIVRQVLLAIDKPVVCVCPTGCLEVSTTPFPYTSWKIPWVHVAFENAATVASGIEAAYKVLKKKGKVKDDIEIVVFAGDGATYDIGLQWLSGAVERGHKFLYVCLNNEAYMNTGIQRSGATPFGAWTTTTPVGKVKSGKLESRKDITGIMIAHNIPYAAQASPHAWGDLARKVRKAIKKQGPSFINVISPCPRGWRYPSQKTIEIARLAVETRIWPLYEFEDGKLTINYMPSEKKPIEEWLKLQGRFSHLLREENREILKRLQEEIDLEWERLLKKAEIS